MSFERGDWRVLTLHSDSDACLEIHVCQSRSEAFQVRYAVNRRKGVYALMVDPDDQEVPFYPGSVPKEPDIGPTVPKYIMRRLKDSGGGDQEDRDDEG